MEVLDLQGKPKQKPSQEEEEEEDDTSSDPRSRPDSDPPSSPMADAAQLSQQLAETISAARGLQGRPESQAADHGVGPGAWAGPATWAYRARRVAANGSRSRC